MKKQLPTYFTVILLIALISACSSNYVATNLDKNNIDVYFSAAKVTIYQQEQDLPTKHHYISVVEGQDCQIKSHHAAPDIINARTQARQQAFNKNANAIIFTGCTTLDNQQLKKLAKSSDAKQCHGIIICYAKAFAIDKNIVN